MTTAGKRLLAAANEALSIAKGEADPSTYIVHAPPKTIDVKAIRKSMDMTQEVFGLRFGFGRTRVRDWEQGRHLPAASDRVLLVTIQKNPDAVLDALAGVAGESAAVARRPTKNGVARKPKTSRAATTKAREVSA